jgi:hypothetical protein
MLKQPAVRAAVLGVALVTTATAFYFIAPVFVSEAPMNGYPTLAYMATRTPRPTLPATETATVEPTTEPLSIQIEPAPLLTGEFYSIVHVGMGQASIHLSADADLTLVLEGFEVEDGPDLHVYLAIQDPVPSTEGIPLEGALDLGALQDVAGDQTYDLPDDLAIENYHSVVIWCVPYNVPFIGASLETP